MPLNKPLQTALRLVDGYRSLGSKPLVAMVLWIFRPNEELQRGCCEKTTMMIVYQLQLIRLYVDHTDPRAFHVGGEADSVDRLAFRPLGPPKITFGFRSRRRYWWLVGSYWTTMYHAAVSMEKGSRGRSDHERSWERFLGFGLWRNSNRSHQAVEKKWLFYSPTNLVPVDRVPRAGNSPGKVRGTHKNVVRFVCRTVVKSNCVTRQSHCQR